MKKRNIMKKAFAILLALQMVVSLAACGNGGNGSDAGNKADTQDTANDTQSTDTADAADTTDTADTADAGDSDAGYAMDRNLSGKITIWTWGDYEIKGSSKFNDYYPNIEMEYVQFDSSEYFEKVVTTLASGGEMPDVVLFESGVRGQFLAMEDTWEVLNGAPYNADTSQLLDWALPLCTNTNGDLLCIQVDNCVGAWAYDRNLTKKYFGTDDPAELEAKFQTLDDYVEAAKVVAEQGNGEDFIFGGAGDIKDAVRGLYTEEAWVTDGKITMDNSYKKVYEVVDELVATGAVGKYVAWTPAWNASWSAGHTVFTGCPTWYASHVLKSNDTESEGRWGLITPPGGGYSNGGTAYAIPSCIDDSQKELAWAWIKYLTMSEEGSANFYEAHSTPTLYKPAYEGDLYAGEPDPFFGGQNIMQKYLEIAQNPNTKARNVTKYDGTIESIDTELLIQIGEGNIHAEEAYQKLKEGLLAAAPELTE